MIQLLRFILPEFFMFIAFLSTPEHVFADPAHQDDKTPSATTTADPVPQADQRQILQAENSANAKIAEPPKGFNASANQVLQETKTNIVNLIESCGNAGLTTLGLEIKFDAKGNIFKVSFTYSVKDGKGNLAGTQEFADDVSSLRNCIGDKLYKYKFNIDVTDDVIELFSQKGNDVITKLWYGSYSFGYRYDEHRMAGLTTYNIGDKAYTAKHWRCRKHGCKYKLNDKFISNKEIESIKREIIDLMRQIPVDNKTMMAPEDKLLSDR